ncbi:HIT domain-containing protein [Eionea flava]
MFVLHPRLVADSIEIGRLPLCRLLLINDKNYPWCVLVPQRESIREIHELTREDRQQLLDESCVLSELMEALFQPVKMNVAALGNMVPQLHLHHIARFESDFAWPNPVWGAVAATPYEEVQINNRVDLIRQAFQDTDLRLTVPLQT